MNKQPKIAIFPGTFDPITRGHLDVIHRARNLFDELIVAIGQNPDKIELFPISDRLGIVRDLLKDEPNVTVEAYEGLTVEFVKRRGAAAILRGLRNMTDLQYEFQLALTNLAVANVETVFVMTNERFGFTSSSLIRQVAALGGNLDKLSLLLPEIVVEKLKLYRDQRLGPFKHSPKDVID